MSTSSTCLVVASGLVLAAAGIPCHAGEVDHLDALDRELAIAEDVFEAALRNSLDSGVRVADVEAHYLAKQGALISFRASRQHSGRLHDHGDGPFSAFEPRIRQLLDNLQISTASYDPDDLAELRELREEQRDIRNEQRSLRRRLRSLRAEAARAEDSEREASAAKIAAHERELEALQTEYAGLDADIDAEYERQRSLRNRPQAQPSRPPEESFQDADLDRAVVQAVCDYGATLKSLPADEFLTVTVRQRRERTFYVFPKRDVVACQRESIAVETLRERATVYQR